MLLQASFGNLNTLADVSEEVVQGRGTKLLIITTSYVQLLNHILEHVTYTSTKYLLDVVDMSKFEHVLLDKPFIGTSLLDFTFDLTCSRLEEGTPCLLVFVLSKLVLPWGKKPLESHIILGISKMIV